MNEKSKTLMIKIYSVTILFDNFSPLYHKRIKNLKKSKLFYLISLFEISLLTDSFIDSVK